MKILNDFVKALSQKVRTIFLQTTALRSITLELLDFSMPFSSKKYFSCCKRFYCEINKDLEGNKLCGYPRIAIGKNSDTYVAVWEQLDTSTDIDIMFALINTNLQINVTSVNMPGLGNERYPNVAVFPTKSFIITWQKQSQGSRFTDGYNF